MRIGALAVIAAVVLLAGAVAAATLLGGGEEGDAGADVADAVEVQLAYLEPESSLVTTLDMRFDDANWGHVRALVSRILREYRSELPLEERAQIPPNVPGALELLGRSGGVSFEEDVAAVLDGYLVVGVALPPLEPLPQRLERLGELLEDTTFDPRRRVYVRVGPDGLAPRPGAPARVVREADGTPVGLEEGRRYFDALQRREDAAESRLVVVYRTPGGDLRNVVEQVLDGDSLRDLPGYEDTVLLDSSAALVGDDTIVLAEAGGGGGDGPSRALRAALDRGRAGRGYPARSLADAQARVGVVDPFVLAAGDATVARAATVADVANDSFDEADLERARREVPYLAAVRSLSASLDIDGGGLSGKLHLGTDPDRLTDEDLPLAPAGALDLPDASALDLGRSPIVSASRDQSVSTSFAARVARALFADSDFVRAAERAERESGIRFEDEVLRQFDCPSVSIFDVRDNRFGARSCLRDPRAMRDLLPRLRPHLPRIVTGLQGLGDGGMLGLLLVAPDAPATPTLPLAQIDVGPLEDPDDAPEGELLYEMGGLRDNLGSDLAQAGPERVVFGMIGESFVVASDRELARQMAGLPTRRHEESVATAIRVPTAQLLADTGFGTIEATVAKRILEELVISAAADRSGLTAQARLGFDR